MFVIMILAPWFVRMERQVRVSEPESIRRASSGDINGA